jgi:hypothetical protein
MFGVVAALLVGCVAPAEEVDSANENLTEVRDADAERREVAVRVHSTYSRATAFGQSLLVGSLFGDLNVTAPVGLDEVTDWVCRRSTFEDFRNHPKQPDDALKRWQRETKDLFGCGWLNDLEVEFLDDPYRDEAMGVWYDDGFVVIGFMDDYPGPW